MILKAFSVRDTKAGVYNLPFFQRTHGEAERAFKRLLEDPQSMMSKFPEDFDLFYLGEYDDSTGGVTPTPPQHMLNAMQITEKKPALQAL